MTRLMFRRFDGDGVMTVKPVKTEADYDAALRAIERLWKAKPGTPAADRLEVLVTLVEAYEAERWPIDPPDPVAAILFRMEQQGLTRRDLESYLGGRGRVSEVLTGKRALTLAMIRKLHAGLGIPLESLIGSAVPRRRTRKVA
jgi:HTH-type transcriptional regulator/antitoxin HigA